MTDPAAANQNAAMHTPNHVFLYHWISSSEFGVGLGVAVAVGVTDAVGSGVYVGMVVVDVGVGVIVGGVV